MANLLTAIFFVFLGFITAYYGPETVKAKAPKMKRLGELHFIFWGFAFAMGGLSTLDLEWPIYLFTSVPFLRVFVKKMTIDLIKDTSKKHPHLDHLSDGMMLCSIILTVFFFYSYPGDWAAILAILLFVSSLVLDALHYRMN